MFRLLFVLLAAVQFGLSAQQIGIRTEPALSDEQAAGGRIFQQKCAVCHLPIVRDGEDPYASRLDGALVARDEGYARRVIENGSAAGMPGWRYTLRPGQIDALMAYLATLDGRDSATAGRARGESTPRSVSPGEKASLLTGTVTVGVRRAPGRRHGLGQAARSGRSPRPCSPAIGARTRFPQWNAAGTGCRRRRSAGRRRSVESTSRAQGTGRTLSCARPRTSLRNWRATRWWPRCPRTPPRSGA